MKIALLEGPPSSQARVLRAGVEQATNIEVGLLLNSGRKPELK